VENQKKIEEKIAEEKRKKEEKLRNDVIQNQIKRNQKKIEKPRKKPPSLDVMNPDKLPFGSDDYMNAIKYKFEKCFGVKSTIN